MTTRMKVSKRLGAVAAVVAVAGLVGVPSRASADVPPPVGTVTWFQQGEVHPWQMAEGLGRPWFTDGDSIGLLARNGAVASFPVPGPGSAIDFDFGANGGGWFTYGGNGTAAVGRLTASPDGIQPPTATLFESEDLVQPTRIAVGADGNGWFTDHEANLIGRVTPEGVITTFTTAGLHRPKAITLGPDGNVWFTTEGGDTPGSFGPMLGKISPSGEIHLLTVSGLLEPNGIVTGSDGNLWVADANKVWRVSPEGRSTAFLFAPLSGPVVVTWDIALGPDGNVWATELHEGKIVRVTPGGAVTEFDVVAPDHDVNLMGIAGSDDGGVWFALRSASSSTESAIGRVESGSLPTCDTAPFLDVPTTQAFCGQIQWLVDEGIATGYPDDTFRPAEIVSRQAIAAFLYRMAGSPNGEDPTCSVSPFLDVPVDHPFCGEIAWAAAEGIAEGYPGGTFLPGDPVSRQAMAAFLYRFAGEPDGEDPTCEVGPFTDVWAEYWLCGEIDWMAQAGITNGYPDGAFGKYDPVSRQAMAAFLYRLDLVPR